MSLWQRQDVAVRAALIAGAFSLAVTLLTIIASGDPESQPAVPDTHRAADDPAYCLDLLTEVGAFLADDPRRVGIFLRKDRTGHYIVDFGSEARTCGINDRDVLNYLIGAPAK